MQSHGKNSDDSDNGDNGDDTDNVAYVTTVVAALSGCSGSCRENQTAATNVTCWPNTSRNSAPPTSWILCRKSLPTRLAEKAARIRDASRRSQQMLGRDLPPVSLIATDAFATNNPVTVWRLLHRRG